MQIKSKCSYDRLVNIEDLKPNPKNNNTHPKNQIELFVKVVKAQGWRAPITVSKRSGLIVSGHARLEVAKILKVKKVPVDFQDFDSDDQELAHLLADNKIPELAKMEDDLTAQILQGLKKTEIDLDLTGYNPKEIYELLDKQIKVGLKDEDATPNVRKRSKVKVGYLYQLDEHRLLCGDSTKREYFNKLLNKQQIDMSFTDPPYGVSYGDKNKFLNAVGRGNRIQENIKGDTLSPKQCKDLWTKSFINLKSSMKKGAPFYICSADSDLMMMMMMSISDANLKLKQSIVWVKNNIILGRRDYKAQHENILYGWNDGAHKFYGGSGQSTVWKLNKPMQSKLHPTMKPVALIEKAILNSSKQGDNVLDLFGGSGSTLIACEKLERRCYMMEIDPHYCDVIIKRWEDFTGLKAKRIN
jgi:DNA modification methylase